MITQTVEEWQGEAAERFGRDPSGWAFQCPHCGYVTCVAEWRVLGFHPEDAPQKCIGRKLPDSRGAMGNTYAPCDWAAFGLFGTLGYGRRLNFPDESREREVFDFPGHGRPRDVLDFMARAEHAGEELARRLQARESQPA